MVAWKIILHFTLISIVVQLDFCLQFYEYGVHSTSDLYQPINLRLQGARKLSFMMIFK